MAIKQYFISRSTNPYVITKETEVLWKKGHSNNTKNVLEMHKNIQAESLNKDVKILEVSSSSLEEVGVNLSAFNLKKYVPSLDKRVPVECIFQAGKVYENGGPYLDILEKSPGAAKKDKRKWTSGNIKSFYYEGKQFPTEPKTLFYDWLYISALQENKELAARILQYDIFTDTKFSHIKGINCQAKTCALYKALVLNNEVDKFLNLDSELISIIY